MPDGGVAVLAAVATRTAIVLIALVVGIRVFGRRPLGEMNVRDLLMILATGNAVQNAMTKGDGHLAVAVVSGGVLLVLGWLVNATTSRHPGLEPYLEGLPLVIARDGRVARANLKRAGVSEAELMTAARKQGVGEIDGIALAVVEVDGSISVVPEERDDGE